MGGDRFEGLQKLSNQEYTKYVPQILNQLKGTFIRAEPYIAVPQKKVHGDIDFLMILAPDVQQKQIVQILKMDEFAINKNHTINSVYKNKQVDFCFVCSDRQFQMMRFYKSYSGFGAYLGMFLPSKQIKLSDSGLYALGYHKHIKFEYLITDDVAQILKFYGLEYEQFQKGFQTKKQLFDFLLNCRFLDVEKLKKNTSKNASKITKLLIEYINNQQIKQQKQFVIYENPHEQTLKYFNKKQQFEKGFEQILKNTQRKQNLNKKFNATHLMNKFNIPAKQVNKLKVMFKNHFGTQQEYQQFVENTDLQHILQKFQKLFGDQLKSQQKNQGQLSKSDDSASQTKIEEKIQQKIIQ